jgi:hypothetical protein
MAIVIEEEKSKSHLASLLGWLIILGIIVAAVYYVFFAAPELVIITPSGNLSAIAPIVQNNLQPSDVLQSPAFKLLKPPPGSVQVSTSTGGRPNPFIAP